MLDQITIWLATAEKTRLAGESLARTLYSYPVDILLSGPLGAGKTSFLQGFASGLGVKDAVTSPTYALEQRYATTRQRELLHLDLYRLNLEQAAQLVHTTDDHDGIRCIEWAERLKHPTGHGTISISLSEHNNGREAHILFDDISLPSSEDIEAWMDDVMLPAHIRAHCHKVAELCELFATHLLERGVVVRKTAVQRAGLVHDLLRFVDFNPDAAPQSHKYDQQKEDHWETLRQHYAGMKHEEACATFLKKRGFHALADIIAVHGLQLPMPNRVTIEQQILFYADKRVALDKIVTVDERFRDFRERYGAGKETEQSRIWHAEALAVERELFPDGSPL